MRVLLRIGFDGTGYRGWQVQPGQDTVQHEIECALKKLLGRPVAVQGAGRTDSGVHSLDMPVHLDVEEHEFKRLAGGLNSCLPPSVRCFSVKEVCAGFHARYDAISRSYRYRIGKTRNPLTRLYEYQPDNPVIDGSLMERAAEMSVGTWSWKGFSKEGSGNASWEMSVLSTSVEEDHLGWNLSITANRFLRGVVRIWSGTLFRIGTGRIPAETIFVILRTGGRELAGPSLPARGLTLTEVKYPNDI
jgi:tRNA pseudouridine38-40 synthase